MPFMLRGYRGIALPACGCCAEKSGQFKLESETVLFKQACGQSAECGGRGASLPPRITCEGEVPGRMAQRVPGEKASPWTPCLRREAGSGRPKYPARRRRPAFSWMNLKRVFGLLPQDI